MNALISWAITYLTFLALAGYAWGGVTGRDYLAFESGYGGGIGVTEYSMGMSPIATAITSFGNSARYFPVFGFGYCGSHRTLQNGGPNGGPRSSSRTSSSARAALLISVTISKYKHAG